MSSATAHDISVDETQLVTFHVDDLLLGLPIGHVQEINRTTEVTPIPHSPSYVRGVINLRGEVTTVIDLRSVLGKPSATVSTSNRNLIVRNSDESVGLLVDRIADIVTVKNNSLNPPPANLVSNESKYFSSVHRLDKEIVVILDLDAVLAHE